MEFLWFSEDIDFFLKYNESTSSYDVDVIVFNIIKLLLFY